MNKSNYLFMRLALVTWLFVQSVLVNASTKIGELYYNLNTTDRTATVTYETTDATNYSSLSSNVTIPATVTYNDVPFTVTTIADQAFAKCTSLESISIPGTVTQVGTVSSYSMYL